MNMDNPLKMRLCLKNDKICYESSKNFKMVFLGIMVDLYCFIFSWSKDGSFKLQYNVWQSMGCFIWSFPQRNRIVSGLSTIGVLIVEAGLKSGSLITAKYALKQKHQIFAIPGMVNLKTAQGTNWLIQSGGAKLVTGVGDILGNSNHCPDQQNLFKDYSNLSDLEKQIVSILENEAMTIDELCQKIKSPVSEISTTISMMLMRDLIVQENDKIYLT